MTMSPVTQPTANSRALRMAAALLLHRGVISLDEIAALPGVDSQEEGVALLGRLSEAYPVELGERLIDGERIRRSPTLTLTRAPLGRRSARYR